MMSGTQGQEHRSPGRPYYAVRFPRYSYLPDKPLGRRIHTYPPSDKDSDCDKEHSQKYCADAPHAQVLKCKFCSKIFLQRKECVKHEKTCDKFYVLPKTVPRENARESSRKKKALKLKCQFCSKKFNLRKNCNRHEKICFQNDNASSCFLCELCGRSYNRGDNLKIHKKKCEESHCKQLDAVPSSSGKETGVESQADAVPCSLGNETGVESQADAVSCSLGNETRVESQADAVPCSLGNETGVESQPKAKKQHYKPFARTPCLYPDCDKEFFQKRYLVSHLKENHKCDIEDPITKQFDSLEEFLAWKDKIEENTFSYFSQKNGTSKNQTRYYYCQHDGISHSRRKTSRTNLKGRVKVGHHCIAKMKTWKEPSGKICLMYFPTHNHVCTSLDFVHHPVSKENNDFINKRLALSVPSRKILDAVLRKDIPKTFNRDQIENCKSSVLSIKRIRERARKANEKKRYHKDEAIAIYRMVEKLSKEDKCVVLYKPYKSEVEIGPKEIDKLQKSEELFMLGIQTERQAQLMTEHCHKVVLVDETHGTNHHKYQLLSIMVVDDNRRGWPVGHLITSKNDADTIQYFFKALKERVQKLVPDEEFKVNCVITDDDPTLINAMEMGFSETLRHLLCKWHLFKAFKKNLRSNVPGSIVDLMMTELRVLVNATEETLFLKLLDGFIKKYESNPQTKCFIEYFTKNYKHRSAKWAMCFRNFPHAQVNTTGHIESFHHRLKKVKLVNRRLDDLVIVLLELEWDDHLTRIREATFQSSNIPQEILNRHKRGMQLDDDQISEVEDNTWDISENSITDKYYIVRYCETCNSDYCYTRCSETSCPDLCAHIYSCSCPDNHPICKHIHKLHSKLKRGIPNQMQYDALLLLDDHPIDTSEQLVSEDPEKPEYIDIATKNLVNERSISQQSKALGENIKCLSDFLENSHNNASALSHAVSVTTDLLLQLKYMTEEDN